MQVRNFFHVVAPIFTALAVIVTAAILVFAIYANALGIEWITFLAGILVAAILAEATRLSRVEWLSMRRTSQLANVRDRLERETNLRKRAESVIAECKPRLHLIDEVLPTMIALIDNEGRCKYHNRAFMEWLRLKPEQIHGRHMREVLGNKVYQETATEVRQSLDGHPVSYIRSQKMPNGAVFKLNVEHIPQFELDGKVSGFYMLMNDITLPSDVQMPGQDKARVATSAAVDTAASELAQQDNQDLFVDSFSEQVFGQKDASIIMSAIQKGDFRLFCQLITPISANADEAEHYEILVRLTEEEEDMMPPGAFFPLAEKYGLMLQLDRWVLRQITEWAARQNALNKRQKNSMFFINVSRATIADAGFPELLGLTLLEHGLQGSALCFEIPDTELASNTAVVAEFARNIRQCGCSIAISGFGRDRILFDLFRGFQVDFLKIDGSVIFDMLRDPVDLAKIIAINKVAQKIGVKTIAELVESEETIAKLKEIGVDFAQGFGISRPRPLAG
jgi:PAS domain S-box-containing protein